MSDYISRKTFYAFEKNLKDDLPIAKSLGLAEEVGNISDNESIEVRYSKRNIPKLSSPVRTKMFKKTPAPAGIVNSLGNVASRSNLPTAGSLNLITHDDVTSNVHASKNNVDDS